MLKRLIFLLSLLIFVSCGQNPQRQSRVIIGVPSDVETFNPMYSFSMVEGNISEILFLSLFENHWDSTTGSIKPEPMIADNWNWGPDSSFLDLELRQGLKWSDGADLTVDDVMYSFELYSNPKVNSRMFGSFENFYTLADGSIDLASTFVRKSDLELRITFAEGSRPDYFDLDFPILPSHYFKGIPFEKIEQDTFNFAPVTSGPYKIKEWYRGQFIKLTADSNSYLIGPESVREIIFKVVPEYTSRLSQLITGEIDLMEDIKTADLEVLNRQTNLLSASVRGREYDYFGWNHLDPQAFSAGEERANKYFGDVRVRNALSKLIDRQEIITNYMKNRAQESFSPVSQIFTQYKIDKPASQEFNIAAAKELLSDAGWMDTNNDGTIDKLGVEFEFTLSYPTGNPRREYSATVFAENAKQAGIRVNIQPMQMGSMIEGMQSKSLDAWIAAWVIPIPLELRMFWHSDPEQAPLNFQGFKSSKIDELLAKIDASRGSADKISAVKEFQHEIAKEQPVAFLYWIDNIIFYNSRIENLEIDPLGVIHHCWNWKIAD